METLTKHYNFNKADARKVTQYSFELTTKPTAERKREINQAIKEIYKKNYDTVQAAIGRGRSAKA